MVLRAVKVSVLVVLGLLSAHSGLARPLSVAARPAHVQGSYASGRHAGKPGARLAASQLHPALQAYLRSQCGDKFVPRRERDDRYGPPLYACGSENTPPAKVLAEGHLFGGPRQVVLLDVRDMDRSHVDGEGYGVVMVPTATGYRELRRIRGNRLQTVPAMLTRKDGKQLPFVCSTYTAQGSNARHCQLLDVAHPQRPTGASLTLVDERSFSPRFPVVPTEEIVAVRQVDLNRDGLLDLEVDVRRHSGLGYGPPEKAQHFDELFNEELVPRWVRAEVRTHRFLFDGKSLRRFGKVAPWSQVYATGLGEALERL